MLLSLTDCGAQTNLFRYLTPQSHQESFDAQLSYARAYYDAGKYDLALVHGEKAVKLDPFSDEAAVTLGYAYLAKVGFMPFEIARTMATKKEAVVDPNADTAAAEAEAAAEKEASSDPESEAESKASSSDALGQLKDILSIDADIWKELGELDTSDPTLPIIVPTCANVARRKVLILEYLDHAIAAICKFTKPAVRIRDDPRHRGCERSDPASPGEVHFLWALSHLIEALVFHSVVTYSTTGTSKTNLESRVDAIQQFEPKSAEDITSFIDRVDSIGKTIDMILPVGDACGADGQTQFGALVNDLITVSKSFKSIPGIPEEMTTSITTSVAKIEKIRSQADGLSQQQAQANVLRGDFTKNITNVLADKMEKLDTSSYSTDQVDSLCGSYANMSGNKEDDPKKPTICK